jgi:hypothetical protein
VRLLILLLLAGLAVTVPFAFMRKPWALKLWRRARLIVVVYVLVVLIAAVVRLIFNWEDIYG